VTDKPLPTPPQGVSQLTFSDMVAKTGLIRERSKALILTEAVVAEFGTQQRSFVRELLVGKTNHMIFTIGYDLKPDFLQRLLQINVNGHVILPSGAETKILATGLYRIGMHPGSFLVARVSSTQKLPTPLLVEHVNQQIQLMLKKPPPKPPVWIPMYEDRDSIIEPPYGKYSQTVQFRQLANDNRRDRDFWLILMTNESIAGKKAFPNSEYITKANDSKTNLNHGDQMILSYQSNGDLSPDTTVSFSIGTSGAGVTVSWNTGKTTLTNHSEMDQEYCRWHVSYNTDGTEAKTTYTWKPAVEVRTEDSKPIITDFRNVLECQFEWQTKPLRIPTQSFSKEYTIKVDPY
jgi:hypothetical protein